MHTDTETRTCRLCGCTDDDCSGCIARTGGPCHWVEEDLCSACADNPQPMDDLVDEWDAFETDVCDRCAGDGTVVTCCDDLCHGQGWCMHGDGESICPVCQGSGRLTYPSHPDPCPSVSIRG
ncbi:MAG: hypothetical protein ACOC4K_00395 [Verrucomicrobiota bacterium]